MYTKKILRKKRKNRKTKKKLRGGVRKTKTTLRAASLWKRLPSIYNDTLCKKVPARNPIIHKCEPLNDTWVEIEYDLDKLTQEESPIDIYKEGSDYDNLAEGIHNFILYWDDVNEYTLATAYYNAPEYGSKHNMIAKRTGQLTPDTFIISGEIMKKENQILFHDVSSQYFVDNKCNMSQQMLKIKVYEIMQQKGWDKDSLTHTQLNELKQTIIDANNFTKPTKVLIEKADFEGFIRVLESKTPGVKGPIYKDYIDLISDIMRDAFERIFDPAEPITVVYEKFKEYGSQKDMNTFIRDKCSLPRPVEFDIYDNSDCNGIRIARSCAKTKSKSKTN